MIFLFSNFDSFRNLIRTRQNLFYNSLNILLLLSKKNKSSDFQPLPKYSSDRLIVKLKPDAARRITTPVPSTPFKFTSSSVSDFGISQLDKIAKDVGVVSLRCIGRPQQKPYDPFFTASASAFAVDVEPQVDDLSRTFVLELDKSTKVSSAISKFQDLSDVLQADYDYLRYTMALPDDPRYSEQWGLTELNCPDAWDRITEGDVTVAVVDTGVQTYHPDLRRNVLRGYDFVDITPESIQLPPGYTWVGDTRRRDGIPADDNGHGTHVAGTIAAVTDNEIGVAGVAWGCASVLPVRVMGSFRTPEGYVRGTGSDADITTGIRWAADQAADVINLSLGGSQDSFVWRDAINYAYSKNCVIVAAMGNEYEEGNPTSYPAAYPNVLAVGAVDESGLRASFSNTGRHIDVVAPGVRILSTYIGGTYRSLNGTSMATPHVAGVAALLKACNRRFSNSQIYNILRNTARELGDGAFNEEYGHGIVDAEAALERCTLSPIPTEATLKISKRYKQGKRLQPKSVHTEGHLTRSILESEELFSKQQEIERIEKKLKEALDYIQMLKQEVM
jgi:subtilisin family serine protease